MPADKGAEVEFEYRLTGVGWSEASLKIHAVSTTLTASYLDDPLGDLIAAVAALPRATSTVRASWAEEPGEFRWVLDRRGDELSVRVLWFDDLRGRAADGDGALRLEATCSVTAFCRAIAAGARAVLEEWGEAGYRKRWREHDFPVALLADLERAL